jgi:hypothetical protein
VPITLYEGDSSFTSQSAHAREAAETIANSAAGSNLNATLHSLKSLLQPASQNNRTVDHITHNYKQIHLPLPAELVLAMLRSYQGMWLTGISVEMPLEFSIDWPLR